MAFEFGFVKRETILAHDNLGDNTVFVNHTHTREGRREVSHAQLIAGIQEKSLPLRLAHD
jgi:hypothetical protein